MRILHILDHSIPLHSGYSFRTLAILREQHKLGWQTCQLTGSKQLDAEQAEEIVDGYRFYRTLKTGNILERLPILNQIDVIRSLEKRLDEVIGKEQPDILHAHSPALNGIAALRAGRRNGLPVVYEMRALWEDAAVDHGTTREGSLRYRLSRALENYVLARCDAVTTISEGLVEEIRRRNITVDSISVVPNGVDIDRFAADRIANPELKNRLGIENKCVLGFIGSFYRYEGLDLLLDALQLIVAKRPDAHLVLVGGGFQEETLKKQVAELGLTNKVYFTGRVSHNEVQDYYSLMDIMVYPRTSIRLTEIVTPLKPLEAMAHGKLVVASNVGGHQELISHDKTGILFTAGNKKALADAVLGLLNDPQKWPALRSNGRAYVEQERNWSTVVGRYLPIYERFITQPLGELPDTPGV